MCSLNPSWIPGFYMGAFHEKEGKPREREKGYQGGDNLPFYHISVQAFIREGYEVSENMNDLKQKIRDAEKEAAASKKKRELKTTAGFAVAYFLVFWFTEGKPGEIGKFVNMVWVSIVMAFIHFGINAVVFDHLHTMENREQEVIDSLKKEIDENDIP